MNAAPAPPESPSSPDTPADPYILELTERIEAGEADTTDLGRLALRLADLGARDQALEVFECIPPSSTTRSQVAARLSIAPMGAGRVSHDRALGDAAAFALRLHAMALWMAPALVVAIIASATAYFSVDVAVAVWGVSVLGSLIVVWPALLAASGTAAGVAPGAVLQGAIDLVRHQVLRHARAIAVIFAPALVLAPFRPGSAFITAAAGLVVLSITGLTAQSSAPFTHGLRNLRRVLSSAPREFWLASSVGALWGLGFLAGALLTRTGLIGPPAASAIFFWLAAVTARAVRCANARTD